MHKPGLISGLVFYISYQNSKKEKTNSTKHDG